jgi:hypothetical protein
MRISTVEINFDLNGIASACFQDCPFCGLKSAFGVLLVSGRSYSRQCRICGGSKNYALLALSKKVIYLDQFVFSNMMKELDSGRVGTPQHHGPFFLELFKQLDRLGKLQLVVCPRSSIHFNESIVAGGKYQKIRAVYEELSRGARFKHHQKIYNKQILLGLKAWLQGKDACEFNPDPAEVLTEGALADWDGWFRPSVNLSVSEEAVTTELSSSLQSLHKGLDVVIGRWKQEHDKKFNDWYAEEIAAHGEAVIRSWSECIQNAASFGALPINSVPELSALNRLALTIFQRLEKAGFTGEARVVKAQKFFASQVFQQIPVVNIGAAMWAGLAHNFSGNKKAWKESIANDIIAVSTYLPFCDAMFLENECAQLLTTNPVRRHVDYKTKIFSLKTKDKFIAYLKEIEMSAPPEHMEKVQEVYGQF